MHLQKGGVGIDGVFFSAFAPGLFCDGLLYGLGVKEAGAFLSGIFEEFCSAQDSGFSVALFFHPPSALKDECLRFLLCSVCGSRKPGF
jgi:hypothetical protein